MNPLAPISGIVCLVMCCACLMYELKTDGHLDRPKFCKECQESEDSMYVCLTLAAISFVLMLFGACL